MTGCGKLCITKLPYYSLYDGLTVTAGWIVPGIPLIAIAHRDAGCTHGSSFGAGVAVSTRTSGVVYRGAAVYRKTLRRTTTRSCGAMLIGAVLAAVYMYVSHDSHYACANWLFCSCISNTWKYFTILCRRRQMWNGNPARIIFLQPSCWPYHVTILCLLQPLPLCGFYWPCHI